MKLTDLTGRRYGRWTVIGYSHLSATSIGTHYWRCVCDCGTERAVSLSPKRGSSSCGCGMRDMRRESAMHGEARRGMHTVEYRTWERMKARCYDSTHPSWHRYGGRGISVCKEWDEGYQVFLAYVGRRPSADHSLDRWPNPNGNYEPGNVRWATRQQQYETRTSAWPRLDGSMSLRAPKKSYIKKADRASGGQNGQEMATISN